MANRYDENNIDTTATTGVRRDVLDKEITTKSRDQEVRVPVVEEEIAVGKRAVETGGVRVESHVQEVPVNESVRLHEEHVNVERRPVDRPVTAGDMAAFKEGTIEMREMAEEAVVEKRARVVEEVVISKEASERTEQITDTVRRTDVDVQPLQSRADFETRHATTWQTHWKSNFGQSGGTFDDYAPAYRYGYDLAGHENLRGRDWSMIERDVETSWESKNKGSWQRFKDAIRYGYDQGRY
jgi:uncharacterized protein (TIGR02271 family)